MNEPYLAVYLRDNLLAFAKKLPKESIPREILEVEIAEIVASEFGEASRKLGGTILGILALWHKDEFSSWGQISGSEVDQYEPSDFDIAIRLISKSVSEKTKRHLPSIESLLSEQSERTKAANEFFLNNWPAIRVRINSFNDGSNA